ncbi:TerC family protein [Piscirickettsia litoralis]|uniref:TerC family protein n=1 Tax=Piscirickettsia litoralis TaxID=1891921 RepID=UPI0013013548|nr:TerC family protein [Piscirickettsia litoralis]
MDVPLAELATLFLTITFLETILAIDNLLFIYVVTAKLPASQQTKAQRYGIVLAATMRILGLLGIATLMKLTASLFEFMSSQISIKDLILIFGGLFLIIKALHEVYLLFTAKHSSGKAATSMASAITQIVLIDAIFSLDSIITAVGLTDHVGVIIAAIVTSCVIMLVASRYLAPLAKSVNVKLLALCCLLFIGVMIAATGVDIIIDKAYLYFAIGFACLVEVLQYLHGKNKSNKPNQLKN